MRISQTLFINIEAQKKPIFFTIEILEKNIRSKDVQNQNNFKARLYNKTIPFFK